MALTEEQIKELRSQLFSQIQHLPPEKKEAAQAQINSLSPEALESMLKQQSENNIFRSIVSGKIEAVKIGENSEAIAVLDINPISQGHTLIIPKKPVSNQKDIPKQAFTLAESLSSKLISNIKAKETKAITDSQFGESIIHLIPIYDSQLDLSSPRSKSTKTDLEKIKQSFEAIKIEKKLEIIKKKKPRGKKPSPIKLNRKIP